MMEESREHTAAAVKSAVEQASHAHQALLESVREEGIQREQDIRAQLAAEKAARCEEEARATEERRVHKAWKESLAARLDEFAELARTAMAVMPGKPPATGATAVAAPVKALALVWPQPEPE